MKIVTDKDAVYVVVKVVTTTEVYNNCSGTTVVKAVIVVL